MVGQNLIIHVLLFFIDNCICMSSEGSMIMMIG